MMTELILTKNNIALLSLSDDTQKFSGEVVAKLADRIIELEAEISALQSRLATLENGRSMETAPKNGPEILAEVKDKSGKYFDFVVRGKVAPQWFGRAGDYDDSDVLRWWPLPGSEAE